MLTRHNGIQVFMVLLFSVSFTSMDCGLNPTLGASLVVQVFTPYLSVWVLPIRASLPHQQLLVASYLQMYI